MYTRSLSSLSHAGVILLTLCYILNTHTIVVVVVVVIVKVFVLH